MQQTLDIDQITWTTNIQETVKLFSLTRMQQFAQIVGVATSGSRRDIALRIQKARRQPE